MVSRIYYTVFFLLLFSVSKVFACSCLEISVAENLKSADIVFKGKIISKVTTTNFDSLNITLEKVENSSLDWNIIPVVAVTIKTDTIYKGCGSDTITIITPPNSAACGVRFQVGEDYIVYSFREMRQPYKVSKEDYNRIFWTHSCTRTNIWYGQEEDAIMKELKTSK